MGSYYAGAMNSGYLAHYGIKGQEWGVRNGPPYPLKGGQYSPAERKNKRKTLRKYSPSNQRHYDTVVKEGTKFQTLSYDKDRTEDSKYGYFYAVYTKGDKHFYRSLFNKKAPAPIYDDKGNEIGTGKFYKYEITNKAIKDLKIASEDSCVDVFADLYSNNRDFYNFIADPDRMKKYIGKSKDDKDAYKYAKVALDKIQSKKDVSKKDIQDVYAYFNYVLANDGRDDPKAGRDIARQRALFFKKLGEKGYSGLLDTNDSLYGNILVGKMPVIVFDPTSVVLTGAKRTTLFKKIISGELTGFIIGARAFTTGDESRRKRWEA